MRVKTIMMPFEQINSIPYDATIKEGLDILNNVGMLSLPVTKGKELYGVILKQDIYEEYFINNLNMNEYLQEKITKLIRSESPSIHRKAPIEEAADLLQKHNLRFLPVINESNELDGIVTHKAIFKEFKKIFGIKHSKITIYTHDYKGLLGKIGEIIASAGGNIKNIVLQDTQTMGIQEINIRVDCKDIEKVIKSLKKNGFDVRE